MTKLSVTLSLIALLAVSMIGSAATPFLIPGLTVGFVIVVAASIIYALPLKSKLQATKNDDPAADILSAKLMAAISAICFATVGTSFATIFAAAASGSMLILLLLIPIGIGAFFGAPLLRLANETLRKQCAS